MSRTTVVDDRDLINLEAPSHTSEVLARDGHHELSEVYGKRIRAAIATINVLELAARAARAAASGTDSWDTWKIGQYLADQLLALGWTPPDEIPTRVED